MKTDDKIPMEKSIGIVLSYIILRLRLPEFIVLTVGIFYKFIVRALLNNLTVIKNEDIIAEATRGKPVGNVDCRFIADE